MPRLEYSERFANDLAQVESKRIEDAVISVLDSIEQFGGLGSREIPQSIRDAFGDVRKVAINPFDLIYTLCEDQDLARIEAFIPQRMAR